MIFEQEPVLNLSHPHRVIACRLEGVSGIDKAVAKQSPHV